MEYHLKAEGGVYGASFSEIGFDGKEVEQGTDAEKAVKMIASSFIKICAIAGVKNASIKHKGVVIDGKEMGDWEIIIKNI